MRKLNIFKKFQFVHPNIQFITDCVDNPLSHRFPIEQKLIYELYSKNYKYKDYYKDYYDLYNIIEYCTFKKFTSNSVLLHLLKSTDHKNLVYISDNYLLGIGYTDFNDITKYAENWGVNIIGQTLMNVRSKIKYG